jgi:hypothetical protein
MTRTEELTKEVVKNLSDFVNTFDSDRYAEFAKQFKREHRTLQQSMIRLFVTVIEEVGDGEYHTDARNEGSKKLCKDIMSGWRKVMTEEFVKHGYSEEKAAELVKDFKLSKNLGYV